jgi:hypothetical protein
MKMFIPACGDRFTLTKDWAFTLIFEDRNQKYLEKLGHLPKKADYNMLWENNDWHSRCRKTVEHSLPEGTVLECDRVYIRQFSKSAINDEDDFDSITFRVINPKNGKPVTNTRFWVKLVDANEIEFKLDPDSKYRDRVKAVKQVLEG